MCQYIKYTLCVILKPKIVFYFNHNQKSQITSLPIHLAIPIAARGLGLEAADLLMGPLSKRKARGQTE